LCDDKHHLIHETPYSTEIQKALINEINFPKMDDLTFDAKYHISFIKLQQKPFLQALIGTLNLVPVLDGSNQLLWGEILNKTKMSTINNNAMLIRDKLLDINIVPGKVMRV